MRSHPSRGVPAKTDGRDMPPDDSAESTGGRLEARYPVSRTSHKRILSRRWGSRLPKHNCSSGALSMLLDRSYHACPRNISYSKAGIASKSIALFFSCNTRHPSLRSLIPRRAGNPMRG